jgi:hypothetical protein
MFQNAIPAARDRTSHMLRDALSHKRQAVPYSNNGPDPELLLEVSGTEEKTSRSISDYRQGSFALGAVGCKSHYRTSHSRLHWAGYMMGRFVRPDGLWRKQCRHIHQGYPASPMAVEKIACRSSSSMRAETVDM